MGDVGSAGLGHLGEQVKAFLAQGPGAVTATAEWEEIDLARYGTAIFILNIGAVSGTNPTLDVKVQHSADGSTWADMSATGMFSGAGVAFAQLTAADADSLVVLVVDRRAGYQHVRLYATIGGTDTPSFTVGASCISHPIDALPAA